MTMSFLFFVLGACVASFLFVIVTRTQAKQSCLKGRSKCTNCEKPIRAFDLIPVISFCVLRGSCRSCKARYSPLYPLGELALGIIFVLIYKAHDTGTDVASGILLRDLLFASILFVIFFYDYLYYLILDRFTIPAMIISFALNAWLGIVSIPSMFMGALIVGGFFFLQFVFSKGEWVGGGDVRMGILMGVMLGFKNALAALLLAYVLGACVGGGLLLMKKVQRKTMIPFGTFLSLATVIMMLYGDNLVSWYLHLLTRSI